MMAAALLHCFNTIHIVVTMLLISGENFFFQNKLERARIVQKVCLLHVHFAKKKKSSIILENCQNLCYDTLYQQCSTFFLLLFALTLIGRSCSQNFLLIFFLKKQDLKYVILLINLIKKVQYFFFNSEKHYIHILKINLIFHYLYMIWTADIYYQIFFTIKMRQIFYV